MVLRRNGMQWRTATSLYLEEASCVVCWWPNARLEQNEYARRSSLQRLVLSFYRTSKHVCTTEMMPELGIWPDLGRRQRAVDGI